MMLKIRLMTWWQTLAQRERVLVAIVTVALTLGLIDRFGTSPLEQRLKAATTELAGLRDRVRNRQTIDAQAEPHAAEGKAREAALHGRLAAAQKVLNDMHRDADQAARMPEVVRSVVAAVGATQLLMLDLTGAAEPIESQAGVRLYRLPITLKFGGTWPELVAVSTQLERDAQSLQWSHLSLDASNWPQIQVTMRAHVLSRRPQWGLAGDPLPASDQPDRMTRTAAGSVPMPPTADLHDATPPATKAQAVPAAGPLDAGAHQGPGPT